MEAVISGTVATKRTKILKGVCANKYEKVLKILIQGEMKINITEIQYHLSPSGSH